MCWFLDFMGIAAVLAFFGWLVFETVMRIGDAVDAKGKPPATQKCNHAWEIARHSNGQLFSRCWKCDEVRL